MEVKSIKFSMKLKINFIKGKSDWQYAQLIPDFQWQDFLYQFFPWGRRWIQSSLDDIENQFQQLREKLAANPNVLQLVVDGGDDHEVPAEKFSGLCFVWKISSMLQTPLYKGCYSNKGLWWTQYLHLQAQQMYFSLWQCWRCSDIKANKQMYRIIMCSVSSFRLIIINQCRHCTWIDSGCDH